jgi:hypothetical protein
MYLSCISAWHCNIGGRESRFTVSPGLMMDQARPMLSYMAQRHDTVDVNEFLSLTNASLWVIKQTDSHSGVWLLFIENQ